MKFALIERDAYRAYLVLGPLNNARMAVARAGRVRPGWRAAAAQR
ncbi:MAG TPA: hypothetical protein VEH31_21695 [Streptosporangiaceae bacterium]|nr:hypothetical protein [Streptosporangiaceae bacterium]